MDFFQTRTNRQKGAVLMMASAFFFTSMQIPINLTADTIPLMEQVFARNVAAMIVCIIFIKKQGGSYFGEKKYRPLLTMRSIFGLLGLVTMFYAVAHAVQADVATITKLSPFLITIFAAIFLKEKIPRVQVPALIIAFAGAAFVANPAFNSNMAPLFAAFLCAVFSSGSYTLLAYFKNKVDGMTIIMYFSTFCVVATIPFMLISPELVFPAGAPAGSFVASLFGFAVPGLFDFTMLLLIGLTGAAGQITLTYAYRMAPAGEVSVYNYTSIVFAVILGTVFLGDQITWNSALGGALVILAAILVYKFSPSPGKASQLDDQIK